MKKQDLFYIPLMLTIFLSPLIAQAVEESSDRKCEMNMVKGESWKDVVFLKAGKEYKFSAEGDSNIENIGLYIMEIGEHSMMDKNHTEENHENHENNENHENSENTNHGHEHMMGGHKEGKVLMQTVGDDPSLCFKPEKDGHYKIKAVVDSLDSDATSNTGKVEVKFKEGCGLF